MGTENCSNAELNKLLRETRAVLAKAGPEFTKFLGMVASFGDEIPEEYKRFRAATKALKAANSMDVNIILKAADVQLEKLREQGKSLGESLKDRKASFLDMANRSKDIDSRIAELKQQLAALEGDKALIAGKLSLKEREIKGFEDNFKAVARKIEQDINGVKDKLSRYLSEDYKPELSADTQMSLTPDDDGASEASLLKTPTDAKKPTSGKERLCPDCNGKMDYYALNKLWKCFVCGHEE